MKKYLPLLLVETYLVFTLLLYAFGPIDFRGHNTVLFVTAMFIYHVAFILGYYLAIKTYKFNQIKIDKKFSSKLFYSALFFAVLSVLATYQNLMLAESIIPYNFFEDVARGIREPGVVYIERMKGGATAIAGGDSGSRMFNILSLFFAFFKLFFIFFFLYFWKDLSYFKKVIALSYVFLFLSCGLASGTNSVIFIFFIFTSLSLLVLTFVRSTRKFLKTVPFMGVGFLIPIGFFGYLMSRRGGGFDYFSGTSPLGDITVTAANPYWEGVMSFSELYYYAFVWLNYYLVQGYYGFSLILNLDQHWTFGFGNSDFLQRQLLVLTGTDVSDLTFQAQISSYWGEAQWHSFYGQFANDFGFAGLSVLMFTLGYFLSRVWASVIYNNSFYGMSLLPIFSLMFIFFPANNQVFGYIDTLSYFLFMSLFWFFEDKRVRFLK